MTYNPDKHHRQSMRLKGYDYAQVGAYFVTVCTQNRECLFGDVVSCEMRENGVGEMILKVWNDLPVKYSDVEIDKFIVMPNHIHGIIVLTVGAGPCACPVPYTDGHPDRNQPHGDKDGATTGGCPYTVDIAGYCSTFQIIYDITIP